LLQIEDISMVASKEHALERVLDKMVAEWAGVPFELSEYRDAGVVVLTQLDPIQVGCMSLGRDA
jgi:dynein heavy chain